MNADEDPEDELGFAIRLLKRESGDPAFTVYRDPSGTSAVEVRVARFFITFSLTLT